MLYEAIYAEQIHRSHFGFPSFYVPVITTNKVRLQSMMEVLKRLTDGKGSTSVAEVTRACFETRDRLPSVSRPASFALSKLILAILHYAEEAMRKLVSLFC